MLASVIRESEQDRCPGALRPWQADDGAIIRVRTPGGRISAEQLQVISRLAGQFGNPDVRITSRGNLEVRGLPSVIPDELVTALDAAGLLPSASHERSRNIFAAPGEQLDDLVADLDAAIVTTPELAALPGRFGFAIADASGVGLDAPWDIAFVADDVPACETVTVSGTPSAPTGVLVVGTVAVRIPRHEAARAMVELAKAFLVERSDERQWNIKDLPPTSSVFGLARAFGERTRTPKSVPWPLPPVSVGAPLGLLMPVAVTALATCAESFVVLPNRTLVPRTTSGEVNTHPMYVAGLVVSQKSSYNRISACIGAPGCRRTESPTVHLAHDLAVFMQDRPTLPRVHICGCDRQCGRPAGEHVSVVNPMSLSDITSKVAPYA